MIAVDTNIFLFANSMPIARTRRCLEHGATTLLTEDRDFSRFRGLPPPKPVLDRSQMYSR